MSFTAEQIEGGVWGLLVGDAVGVPYEFTKAVDLPERSLLEMTPPPGFSRAHAGTPPGTWSDDGAQALCLLDGLLDQNGLDLEDLAHRFVRWWRDGYLAVDGRVFDIGIQTGEALRRVGRQPAETCGGRDVMQNGNGSLMRTLPLALWHRGTDADLVRDAMAQSRITHGHLRSQVCCALYALWARCEAEDGGFEEALRRLRPLLDGSGLHELQGVMEHEGHGGSGYVVDSLHSARHALLERSYEAVVKAAIALGEDTDTTACIAGGIAGIRHGVDAIPARWLRALRGRELARPLVDALLAHRGL